MQIPESKLSPTDQKKTFTGTMKNGDTVKAVVRYGDSCGNGHNSFAITGEITEKGCRKPYAFGCCHSEIAEAIPELAPFIQWHLCRSDEPMHYRELDAARRAAVWPEATDEELSREPEELKAALRERLPVMMQAFKTAVESFGFVY